MNPSAVPSEIMEYVMRSKVQAHQNRLVILLAVLGVTGRPLMPAAVISQSLDLNGQHVIRGGKVEPPSARGVESILLHIQAFGQV